MKRPAPTQQERTFSANEIIVSKTDAKGRLTYVNDVFCTVGLYDEAEVIGQPHSIVRHPDMPRTVFAMLWERIQAGEEIFAYVKNMAKNGDFYWVLAHVTPSFDLEGRLEGYHSNRRRPSRKGLDLIGPVYRQILEQENRFADRRTGLQSGIDLLQKLLSERGTTYDEFILATAE